jgi:hypothetical protein
MGWKGGGKVMTRCLLPLMVVLAFVLPRGASGAEALANDEYQLTPQTDGSVLVRNARGSEARLSPTFAVMFSLKDPKLAFNWRNFHFGPRWAVRWGAYEAPVAELNEWLNQEMKLKVTVTEDSQGERVWDYGDGKAKVVGLDARGTTNPFLVGNRNDLLAVRASREGDVIKWHFPESKDFSLSAELSLPAGEGAPVIRYALTANRGGFYSVVFTGMPGVAEADAVPVPQPAIGWNSNQSHFVMLEVNERLPRAHVSDGQRNYLAIVHPDSASWRDAMALRETSRFGTMIRKEQGKFYPAIVAPVMGTDDSKLKADQTFQFQLIFALRDGGWQEAFRHVAENIYGFRDMRDNSGPGPLHLAIGRVMDYLRDKNGKNFAQWDPEQKYYNYWSDQSGIFKPFSPIFGLSAAVILDDEDFYRNRALPVVEMGLSRMGNVFAPYDIVKTGQAANTMQRNLGSPYMKVPQLVTLWDLYRERTHAFKYYAHQKEAGTGMMDFLAQWRLTGDEAKLQMAKEAALKAAPWNGGAYFDFLEVYEATGEEKLLEAARERLYTKISQNVNLFPAVPDRDVVFDAGGKVPVHYHSSGRHRKWGFPPPQGLPTEEKKAPAWRGSEIGLETFSHHRAELWLNLPPQYLRVAAYSGDKFLRTLARSAMVGRYGNYAGDNRTQRSLVTELPDAMENPVWLQNYSSFNPGHAWEVVGAMIDYLVTDCFDRSDQKISFPASTMAGGHFRVQAFGARPGRFYDEENVQLWCPPELLSIDNPQFEWIAGWGNGKLYVAIWNQSFREEKATLKFNPERATFSKQSTLRRWVDNTESSDGVTPSPEMNLSLSPKGITAFAIDGAALRKTLQGRLFGAGGPKLGPGSIQTLETPFGKLHGLLLSMGAGLTNAFVYTDALPEDVITARLKWRQGQGEWQTLEDGTFPFEFSMWLDEAKGDFECEMEVETTRLEMKKSSGMSLLLAE